MVFSWDDIEQTVVADVETGNFISGNIQVQSSTIYRILNSYNDLCVIIEIHNHSNTSVPGFDGIFEDATTLPQDFKMSVENKRKVVNSSSSIGSRKVQRPKIGHIKFASEKGKECVSIEVVVDALRAIVRMDDVIFLEACKLLENERNAKIFVAMNGDRRRKWLFKKLHIC